MLFSFFSANANTFEFNCRNENPHIIGKLLISLNTGALEGTVIVGFVRGRIDCPLIRVTTHAIECSGQYRLPGRLESFRAILMNRFQFKLQHGWKFNGFSLKEIGGITLISQPVSFSVPKENLIQLRVAKWELLEDFFSEFTGLLVIFVFEWRIGGECEK